MVGEHFHWGKYRKFSAEFIPRDSWDLSLIDVGIPTTSNFPLAFTFFFNYPNRPLSKEVFSIISFTLEFERLQQIH
jgi:hypothetical protein